MEPTEDSEMSAEFKRTPGMYPKEHIQHLTTLILTTKKKVCFVDSRLRRLQELSLAVSIVQRTDKRGNENFQLVVLSAQR